MISILPIQPDILQMMAEDTGLTAEGPVWGYFAAEGTKMLGYVVVERAEPVRIIALQCEDFVIADGLLRRALHPFYEEGSKGYTFACEVPMPLPMAYTRRGAGSLEGGQDGGAHRQGVRPDGAAHAQPGHGHHQGNSAPEDLGI